MPRRDRVRRRQDLLNAAKADEVMASLELTSQKSRWVHVAACSAKTGDGLDDGVKLLIEEVNKAKGGMA